MKLRLAAIGLLWATLAHAAADRYAGVHGLGVNRVSTKRRSGSVTFTPSDGGWTVQGEARDGPHYLRLQGTVVRVDDRELLLEGELQGVPDMSWRDEPPRERTTRGKLTFRATKGRTFWRLYEVDGTSCVCDDSCGNDFCYIDIDIATSRVAVRTPSTKR